jgi:hypothetical protein
MRALRKDLLDRRLWPLVALLVAAVVAVPVLALKHASASPLPAGALPGPTAAAEAGAASGAAAAKRPTGSFGTVHDPFASGAAPSTSAAAAAPSSTTTASAPASAVTAATPTSVSPAPVAGSPTPATSTDPSRSGSNSASNRPSGAATTSPDPVKPDHPSVSADTQPRTIYAVDVRFGADANAPVRRDIARLATLPSASRPVAMYLGVLAGGKQAVFELNSKVQHAGPGVCRPSIKVCSAILLRAGQTETLKMPVAGGAQRQFMVRVVDIRSRVTRSYTQALAAYERHSAAGLCELALADPMAYSLAGGTLTGVAGALCTNQAGTVPFPSAAQSG